MAAPSSLAAVLQNPAVWRGSDCAPEPSAIATGFAPLDAVLPGGGWPAAALTEIMLEREGIGEISLTLPALVRLQEQRRDVVWIAPPHVPYAPALVAAGLDLRRFIIVRCPTMADQLWAFEQALRAPECGAAFAWLATPDERLLRRLQVAARDGGSWGVLWRRPGQRALASAAPLRLALAPHEGRLSIEVRKRRGGEVGHPIVLDINPSAHAPTPSVDVRSSAGRPAARRRLRPAH